MNFFCFVLASSLVSLSLGEQNQPVNQDVLLKAMKNQHRSTVTDEGNVKKDQEEIGIPELLKSPDALERLQQLKNLLNTPASPNLNYQFDPFTQTGPVTAPYLRTPASHSYSNVAGYGPSPSVKYVDPHQSTSTLLNMLNDIQSIKDSSWSTDEYGKTDYKKEFFDTTFKHLWHFLSRQGNKRDFCPEHYDQVDDLCLIVDEDAKNLEYPEARLSCKARYGGDLAVIRTPNEHRAIVNYLWKKDPKAQSSYFLGCSRVNDEFTWLDGRRVEFNSPFFSSEPEISSDPRRTSRSPNVSPSCGLNRDKFLFVDIISATTSDNFIPLCQYIHGRDEANFHYSQQIYWTNFDKKYNKWFFPPEDYKITIKHRYPDHDLKHPQPYGYQPHAPYAPVHTSNSGYNEWAAGAPSGK